MKKLFLLTFALLLVLFSCKELEITTPNGNNGDNKTYVVFDNTNGVCAVTVYNYYARRESDIIAVVPAGMRSDRIEQISGEVPFYYTYHVSFKGINGFVIDYTPSGTRGEVYVRLDKNKRNSDSESGRNCFIT